MVFDSASNRTRSASSHRSFRPAWEELERRLFLSANPVGVGPTGVLEQRGIDRTAAVSLVADIYRYEHYLDEESLDPPVNEAAPPVGSFPSLFEELDGQLYFQARSHLYKFDPATKSASLVANTALSYSQSSYPSNLNALAGKLYFTARDGSVHCCDNGVLFTYDPVSARVESLPAAYIEGEITIFQDELYLNDWESPSGFMTGLYRYDPGSEVFSQVHPRSGEGFTEFNGSLYFNSDQALYRYDPVSEFVSRVSIDFLGTDVIDPIELTVLQHQLYFSGFHHDTGRELYRYDAATDEVSLVADLNPGWRGSDASDLTVSQGELYFRAGDDLYRYDPAADVVSPVMEDVWEDAPRSVLVPFDGELYFAAYTETSGVRIYGYNRAADTVTPVADFVPPQRVFGYGEPDYLRGWIPDMEVFNGELYFAANDGTTGSELWKVSSRIETSVPIPGDADGDGKVGFLDFASLASNFGRTDAAWKDGDFDRNGRVDFRDFAVIADNYGRDDGQRTALLFTAAREVARESIFAQVGSRSTDDQKSDLTAPWL